MLKKLFFYVAFFFAAAAFAAVDVNQATEADLDGINGIGPGLSQRILAERMGVVKASPHRPAARSFAASKAQASPKERKVWALWNQLGRDGVVHNTSATALNVWVERTVHVSALRFANSAQLDVLIEALKAWQQRGASDA